MVRRHLALQDGRNLRELSRHFRFNFLGLLAAQTYRGLEPFALRSSLMLATTDATTGFEIPFPASMMAWEGARPSLIAPKIPERRSASVTDNPANNGALLIGGTAFAGSFRVHYNVRGSGRDVPVQAESSAEARRMAMEIFPGAVVTSVSSRGILSLCGAPLDLSWEVGPDVNPVQNEHR